jgi:hypothetical protein
LELSPRRILISFLLTAFLVAQGALLSHHTEIEAHVPGEECELCLHTSNLKNPFGNDALAVFTTSISDIGHHSLDLSTLVKRYRTTTRARAPPINSLS